jgi:transposase
MLRQVERPDEVVIHEPGACAGCGAQLAAENALARVIRRQVFDIPQITVRVTEHGLVFRRCSCGTLTCRVPRPA